jgi:hypothetical protein
MNTTAGREDEERRTRKLKKKHEKQNIYIKSR